MRAGQLVSVERAHLAKLYFREFGKRPVEVRQTKPQTSRRKFYCWKEPSRPQRLNVTRTNVEVFCGLLEIK